MNKKRPSTTAAPATTTILNEVWTYMWSGQRNWKKNEKKKSIDDVNWPTVILRPFRNDKTSFLFSEKKAFRATWYCMHKMYARSVTSCAGMIGTRTSHTGISTCHVVISLERDDTTHSYLFSRGNKNFQTVSHTHISQFHSSHLATPNIEIFLLNEKCSKKKATLDRSTVSWSERSA